MNKRGIITFGVCGVLITVGCTRLRQTPIDSRSLDNAARPSPVAPPATGPTAGDHFRSVLVVVLENQNYADAIKNPLLKKWADRGLLLEDFRGLFHPSYHNYLSMVCGRTFAAPDHKGDKQIDIPADVPTIGDELQTWRNYAENYPPPNCRKREGILCLDSGGGRYARRHVPFISFIGARTAHPRWIVGVDPANANNQFFQDAQNDSLPQYAFYSPNVDDDGHDPGFPAAAGLEKGANWVDGFLTRFLRTPAAAHTLVVITYDESYGGEKSNRIYTVLLGKMVPAGTILSGPAHHYNHYNVLRTIDDNFHVPPVGPGDAAAKPIPVPWLN